MKERRGTTWSGPGYLDTRPLHIESEPYSFRSLCTQKRLSLIVTDESRPTCKRCLSQKARTA
jgi:hypothetical protein